MSHVRKEQFDFRSLHNQLTKVIDDIEVNTNKILMKVAVFMDIEKVFDSLAR